MELLSALVVVVLSAWAPTFQAALGITAIVVISIHWWWRDREWKKERAKRLANPPDLLWADHSAAGCATIRQMLESGDRNKLKGALASGSIISWGRTKGFPDPRAIPTAFWTNDTLMFADVGGAAMSYLGMPPNPKHWRTGQVDPTAARYYDIHFNKAQLQRYFPDRRF